MATNAWVVPKANEGLAGVTAIDTSTAGPTLSVADPLIDPEVAVIVAVPTPAPVANPPEPMLATVVKEELQLTVLLKSCVLPSL